MSRGSIHGFLNKLVPVAWHHVERYANDRIEADHGRLTHRQRPMRGLRTDRTAHVVFTGLAFLQDVHRGHYELATESPRQLSVAASSPSSHWRSEQQTHPASPCSGTYNASVPRRASLAARTDRRSRYP
jgi:hypothetical protein